MCTGDVSILSFLKNMSGSFALSTAELNLLDITYSINSLSLPGVRLEVLLSSLNVCKLL